MLRTISPNFLAFELFRVQFRTCQHLALKYKHNPKQNLHSALHDVMEARCPFKCILMCIATLILGVAHVKY